MVPIGEEHSSPLISSPALTYLVVFFNAILLGQLDVLRVGVGQVAPLTLGSGKGCVEQEEGKDDELDHDLRDNASSDGSDGQQQQQPVVGGGFLLGDTPKR